MQEPRSFIVRLYRLEPEQIAGVVEDVQTGKSTPFHSLGELWAVLTRSVPRRKTRGHETPSHETHSPGAHSPDKPDSNGG